MMNYTNNNMWPWLRCDSGCLYSSSDHSGWFSGLSRWRGWRRRRRRRAVSEEATSLDFLKLIVLIWRSGWTDLVPFFLLWVAHWSMVCLCHFSFSVRRRLKLRPWLTAPPPPPLLFFSSVEGDEETLLETACYSLLILYWPFTNSLLRGSQPTLSPLPFQPSSMNLLFFQFWFSSKLFSHHHHLLFTDQLEFLLRTTALRWFPVLICCYSNRSIKLCMTATQEPVRPHLFHLQPFGTWTNELQRGGKATTSQCTKCSAGQSG